jgi:hypothetical protein
MSIHTWNTNPGDPGAYDEHFWHATSLQNAERIRDAEAIKPDLGKGMNGKGFYCCTRVSDYQKAMALRNDSSNHPYLYLLKVRVKDFYKMEGFFCDGFAGDGSAGDEKAFIASRWAADNVGGCGNKRPDEKVACYEEYLLQQLDTPGWTLPTILPNLRSTKILQTGRTPDVRGKAEFEDEGNFKANRENRDRIWEELWYKAKRNSQHGNMVSGAVSINYISLDHGPRAALLRTIEEITFKQAVGKNICVVAARRFGKAAETFDVEADVDLDEID